MFYKRKTRRIHIKNNSKLFFIIVFIYLLQEDKILYVNRLNHSSNVVEKVEVYQLKDMFLSTIKKNKTILLFEPNHYHYECSPGYAKYFVDLGFNVDILMQTSGLDSFYYFEKKDKIRLFIYIYSIFFLYLYCLLLSQIDIIVNLTQKN